jgi:hypothetical protein
MTGNTDSTLKPLSGSSGPPVRSTWQKLAANITEKPPQ